MFTVVGPFLIPVSPRYLESHELTPAEAAAANFCWLERFYRRVNYAVARNPDWTEAEIFAEAERLESELESFAEQNNSDPIMTEAIIIAKEQLELRLEAEGLPVPTGIEAHTKVLAENNEAIQAEARLRVEARLRASLELTIEPS